MLSSWAYWCVLCVFCVLGCFLCGASLVFGVSCGVSVCLGCDLCTGLHCPRWVRACVCVCVWSLSGPGLGNSFHMTWRVVRYTCTPYDDVGRSRCVIASPSFHTETCLPALAAPHGRKIEDSAFDVVQ